MCSGVNEVGESKRLDKCLWERIRKLNTYNLVLNSFFDNQSL